jgi:acetylornithine deacetylase/succinyl-diaminopimelate desuccinylase-like protein
MISVFTTSVINSEQAARIKPYLDQLHTIRSWNFDFEDCDNILRIDSSTAVSECITDILEKLGFQCKEIY